MRNLDYHKSLDTISIGQLNKIKESISEGKPEYRYLMKLDSITNLPNISTSQLKVLEQAYLDLFAQMENINIELISLYRIYLESYLKIKIEQTKKSLLELQGNEVKQIAYTRHNIDFMSYINALNQNHTNFQIVEYYVPDNFMEIFAENFKDVEFNSDFRMFFETIEAFYTIDRYVYEVKNMNVSTFHKNVFLLPEFLELFISSRLITITDIIPYVERLREEFILNDNFDSFIDFRHRVFDLNNFQFENEKVIDFMEEVVNVKQAMGFDFDIYKVSAKEYFSYLKAIRARSDKEPSKDNSK